MSGGCVNLPIIPLWVLTPLFDLDAMCMFVSPQHKKEKGTETLQSALLMAANQQFTAVCAEG